MMNRGRFQQAFTILFWLKKEEEEEEEGGGAVGNVYIYTLY